MTRTAAAAGFLPMPREGRAAASRPALAPAPRSFEGPFRSGSRWAGVAEVAAGVLLLVLWALLWSVLLAGVASPGGRLASHAAGVGLRREAVLRIDTGARAP
jgi:hypothetical protein